MRKASSERMKRSNPMHDPDAVARAVANRPQTNPKTSATRKRMFAEGTLAPNRAGEAARKRFSERMKRSNPMHRPDVVERVTGRKISEETREKMRRRWDDPEYRAAQVERMKRNNPMRRVEVLEKSLSGPRLHNVATKMEKWFAELCASNQLPIWYSGLNSYWVSGRNPDFKVHDRKLVIEITDGYTFKKKARNDENYSLPTIVHYEAHGHSCLVVMMPERRHKWTADLQSNLLERVRSFLATGQSAIWSFAESSK